MSAVRKITSTTFTGTGLGPTVGELMATLQGLPVEARVNLTTRPDGGPREPSTWTVTVMVQQEDAFRDGYATAMQSGYMRDAQRSQFGDH